MAYNEDSVGIIHCKGKLVLIAALLLLGCGGKTTTMEQLALREATLPDGTKILCEVMIRQEDMARGMMFRDWVADDRGMLFLHAASGTYPYWMFQCKIALDIIWMDESKRIVEISADTPPCTGVAETCPNYGGKVASRYVLELAGGSAWKHNLKLGEAISF
jgi:hypothetical protein